MGKLRKIGKKIGNGIKKVGRKLKKGLGNIAKAFGKLGPLGSVALSFIIPGMGGWLNSLAGGNSFLRPVANGLLKASKVVSNGVGRVFNRVTDAVEWSMNAVTKPFMQEGARGAGSAFRDWVSNTTSGFIDKSTAGVKEAAKELNLNPDDVMSAIDNNLTTAEEVRKQAYPDLFKEKVKKESTGLTNLKVAESPDKPSIFAEGDYDSAKARVRGSREFDVYKKIRPVQRAGTDMIAEDDALLAAQEQQREQQRAYFTAEAQSNLYDNSQDTRIAYYDFNAPASDEDEFRLLNSYSGILVGGLG